MKLIDQSFNFNRERETILRELLLLGLWFHLDFQTLKTMDFEELFLFLESCKKYLGELKTKGKIE